jgi:hypothetical protein
MHAAAATRKGKGKIQMSVGSDEARLQKIKRGILTIYATTKAHPIFKIKLFGLYVYLTFIERRKIKKRKQR